MINTTVSIEVAPDSDPDASYLYQPEFEERFREYEAGHFSFVGVRVCVRVHNTETGVTSTTKTAGLWGIESDSGDDYFREVATDEAFALDNVDVSRAPIVWVN